MKITKTDLRKIIEEELGSIQQEGAADLAKAGLGALRKFTGHAKTKQDIGKQSQLEKNVTGLLQQMQAHMAQPGQQVNTRTVKLLQKAFKTMGGQDLGTGASGELKLGTKGVGTGKGEDATRYAGTGAKRRGVEDAPGSKPPKMEESLDEDALVAEIIKRLGGE